jgi:hypothetical protein
MATRRGTTQMPYAILYRPVSEYAMAKARSLAREMRPVRVELGSRRGSLASPDRYLLIAYCALLGLLAGALVSPGVVAAAGVGGPAVAELRGDVAGYFWEVTVGRGRGPQGSREPCVSAALVKKEKGAVGGRSSVCGSLQPGPLRVEQSSGDGTSKRAVMGMIFTAETMKVEVWLRGRGRRLIKPHLISRHAATRGHLAQVRYGAIATAGNTCVVRIVPYEGGKPGDTRYAGSCGR